MYTLYSCECAYQIAVHFEVIFLYRPQACSSKNCVTIHIASAPSLNFRGIWMHFLYFKTVYLRVKTFFVNLLSSTVGSFALYRKLGLWIRFFLRTLTLPGSLTNGLKYIRFLVRNSLSYSIFRFKKTDSLGYDTPRWVKICFYPRTFYKNEKFCPSLVEYESVFFCDTVP